MYKYMQLATIIESKIESGEIMQGQKLESIRELSKKYSYNKSTVIKALDSLIEKGIIYSMPQSGYYAAIKDRTPKDTIVDYYNFALASPDPKLFPYIDFQKCINQAIQRYKEELFIYGTPKGLPSLIVAIQKLLMNYQIFTKVEDIFITSGVQQALSLLVEMPFPNEREKILVEQPTYHLLLEHLATLKVPIEYIERKQDGINLDELESIFRKGDVKFFYIMPRKHNPLGASLSNYEKEKIVKLAYKYNVYLVEDDYLVDFETNKKNSSLYEYDINKSHVIYLKSFSKIMFPGLRVGVVLLPEPIRDAFSIRKKYADIDTSMISQAALEIYIKSGMFEQHSFKIGKLYQERAECLHQALQDNCKEFSSINYTTQKNKTIHTCIELQKPISIEKLKRSKIYCEDISVNYGEDFIWKKNYLKINVSNVDCNEINTGVERLIDIINL